MARNFRSGQKSFIRGSRRETLWSRIVPSVTTLASGADAALINSLSSGLLAIRPFTIIRTHVELLIISDQQAAAEFCGAAFGTAVVSDQASAIGVTAVPTPDTDGGSDLWMSHQYMWNSLIFASAVGLDTVGRQYTVDSKAMRKVDDGQDFVVVLERMSIGSGATIFVAGRILIKTN